MSDPARAVLLDVDGTLVDTNYLHVLAWQRALRDEAGVEVPAWRLHRTVGKGGDRYVAAVAGDEVEERCGDDVRDAHEAQYRALIAEVRPLPGARDLIAALKERGVEVVLASSGKGWEVDHYLDLLDARDLLDGWTTSDDVESSKPSPDLIHTALESVSARPALLVGDTVWDAEAARRAGVAFVAVLCGGFGEDELIRAGAQAIYETPVELIADLDGAGVA